jgi:hypothetical protein
MVHQEKTPSAQHTPGSWRADGPYKIIIDGGPIDVQGMMVMNVDERHGYSFPIARVTGPAYCGREDECAPELVANALLIAAAPELLEALEMIDEWSKDSGEVYPYWIVDAAIAKAKGKAA